MDDFKRFYSNNDEDKSVPYFWEKFDPEHYSIWLVACSNVWRSCARMPLLQCASLARITTTLFPACGYGAATSWPSLCVRTGRLITRATTGSNLMSALTRPRVL